MDLFHCKIIIVLCFLIMGKLYSCVEAWFKVHSMLLEIILKTFCIVG